LRKNLDTALPLWPIQKTLGFKQKKMRIWNSLRGLALRSAVVCVRRLLSVVQARRRGSALFFTNPRRGSCRDRSSASLAAEPQSQC